MADQDPDLVHKPVPEPMPQGPGPAAINLAAPENAHIQEAILARGKAKTGK